MKVNNLKGKVFLTAGILAIAMTGCGKTSGEIELAVPEVVAVEEDSFSATDNAAVENTKLKANIVEQDTASKDTEIVEQEVASGRATSMANAEIDDPELVKAVTDALKTYFDVTFNAADYQIGVSYFEGFEDLKPSYSVVIDPPGNMEIRAKDENIGIDGFPTEEELKKLKPEFFATFSEDRELTGLYVNYLGWEKIEKPLSMEETKAVAKEFLLAHEMIKGGKIEFMGFAIISNDRTVVTYQNGKDGAIQVAVNIAAGKVEHFEYMTKERAEMILRPKAESELVG